MITRKIMRVIGSEDYIKADTGEVVTMAVSEYLEERDYNFTKVWLKDFAHVIGELAPVSQKHRFLAWVMTHTNRENQIPMTIAQMAQAAGISRIVAGEVMKTLKKMNFIKKVGVVYMLNPDVIFKGSTKLRMEACRKYNQK